MTTQEIVHNAIFAFLTLVTIGSAITVASTRRLIHAAFWLFPTFAGVAGFYLFLGAQFLAAIQVLIYIGAILVLIIFAVTLTRNVNDSDEQQSNRFVLPMILSALVLLIPLIGALLITHWPEAISEIDNVAIVPNVFVTDVSAIGIVLLQQYLVPFEIASVLLLAAMVGALVLARKELPEVKATNECEQLPELPSETRQMAEVAEV